MHLKNYRDALLLCLVAGLLLPSCSTGALLTRENYRRSVEALREGDATKALQLFPEGEGRTFIPLLEKTYLNLIQGRPEIDELQAYAVKIEERVKYRVSRELKFLMYVETPEGYFASEHEIIWMHMLLSWGYSLRNDFDRAAIEAKKSALLLEGKSREGRFDDPMIRIILGVLWAMCDRWEDARVDFRVAARQDPTLKWAATLSEMEAPPEELALMLTGTGPEPYWDPKIQWNPIRGLRDMEFRGPSIARNIYAHDRNGRRLPIHTTPDSGPWYRRHIERDNEIHNLIGDSHYGERVLFSTVKGGVKAGAGITGGIIVGALGVAIGGAIVYAGGQGHSGEVVFFGFTVMVAGVRKGYEIGRRAVKSSVRSALDEMDVSDRYRYVRYLPSQAIIVFGRGERPLRITTGKRTLQMEADIIHEGKISIRYMPPES